MSIDVRVPTTGNAGEDAVIVDWNVAVGAQVSAGDVLVTLETAKATIEVEAPEGGQVLKILFESGAEVPEHEVLAILGVEGEAPAESGPASDADDPGATAPAEPAPAVSTSDATTSRAASTSPAASAVPSSGDTRAKASPRARILAERNGIDLSALTGSGPGGRIIIADVLAAKKQPTAAAAFTPTPAPQAAASPDAGYDLVPVRGARKVTAQRMHASLAGTAQVTLTRYSDATAMLAYVKRLRAVTEAQGLPKIGVNDVLLFATARAVVKHPAANSVFDWDGIRQYRSVNLGFAVDTGQALLVPVIPGADRLSLAAVAEAAQASIEKARSGKLATAEMEGGTFTVSNLGSLGVHWFTPVLNTPQSCILGVGAAHQSHPDAPSLLPLSLTFDHRALDGAAAAQLLADIAKAIETVDVLSAF
ncbi:dihydrolipoamide acetyltransferase family protein [Herbiconiux sp.]|uniref:dihydrolipoamide acetyltransferase family protein n=1 Tax=Herbiconiux sp. TaxID=1871186 RepID=UPI0025C495EF|nr:dihydrolipoamide acetyltransferase family protein [Herbiconiux sp.]